MSHFSQAFTHFLSNSIIRPKHVFKVVTVSQPKMAKHSEKKVNTIHSIAHFSDIALDIKTTKKSPVLQKLPKTTESKASFYKQGRASGVDLGTSVRLKVARDILKKRSSVKCVLHVLNAYLVYKHNVDRRKDIWTHNQIQ